MAKGNGVSEASIYAWRKRLSEMESDDVKERWPRSFLQVLDIFKWDVRGSHAADLVAGSVAKCALSGVRSARLEWGAVPGCTARCIRRLSAGHG